MLAAQGCRRPYDNNVTTSLGMGWDKWRMSVTFPEPFNNTGVGAPTLNDTEFIFEPAPNKSFEEL